MFTLKNFLINQTNRDFKFFVNLYERVFNYLYQDCVNLQEVYTRIADDQELVCILCLLEDFMQSRYGQGNSQVTEALLEIHESFVGQLDEYKSLTPEDLQDPSNPQKRAMELVEDITGMQRSCLELNYKKL